jgi:hypothetical protein
LLKLKRWGFYLKEVVTIMVSGATPEDERNFGVDGGG